MSNGYSNQGQDQQFWSGYPQQAQQPQQSQWAPQATQHHAQQPQQQYQQQPFQRYGQQPVQQYSSAPVQQQYAQPAQQYGQQPVQQYNQQPIQGYGQQHSQPYGQQFAQQPNHQYAQQYSMHYGQVPMQQQGQQGQQGQQQQSTTTTTTTTSTNNQYQSMMQQGIGQQAVAQQQQPVQNQYAVQQQNMAQQPAHNQFHATQQQLPNQQKIQDDISRLLQQAAQYQTQPAAPQPAKPSIKNTNTSTTTTTTTTTNTTNISRTERYQGEKAGGRARKAAEKEGEKSIRNFEEKVALILERFITACKAERWYCMKGGYLCSNGRHLVYHKDIDRAVEQPGHVPTVLPVNTWISESAAASGKAVSWHPPQVDPEQPMHETHGDFIRECVALGCVSGGGSEFNDCDCVDQFRQIGEATATEHLTRQGFAPGMEQHVRTRDRLGIKKLGQRRG